MADALGFRRKRAIAALGLSFLLEEEAQQPRKRSRKVYMRDWIALREERGIYHQLVKELETGNRVAYKEFFRMTKQQFCFLVEKVSPLIEKKQQPSPINSVRSTIKPDERLAVTLRYLATGESFHSLEYSFRISRQSISSIVYETSRALYQVLAPEFLKVPSTEREWQILADKFESRWNFPHGIGAIDGKRVIIQDSNSKRPPSNAIKCIHIGRFHCILKVRSFGKTSLYVDVSALQTIISRIQLSHAHSTWHQCAWIHSEWHNC